VLALLLISWCASDAFAKSDTPAEDISFCQLAANPAALGNDYESVLYSYIFAICSLKSPARCPNHGAKVWVDFGHDRAKGLLRKHPKGMGTVPAIFVDKVGTGKVFAANGLQARRIVDKIEKVAARKAEGKSTVKQGSARLPPSRTASSIVV
jgi:hypothetical protein